MTAQFKKTCIVCGKSFHATRNDARYCSNSCAKKASRSGNTAKIEKEIERKRIEMEQQRINEENRKREEKEKKEWDKFVKEYTQYETRCNAKKYVRDKLSEIIFAVKQHKEEKERQKQIFKKYVRVREKQIVEVYEKIISQENLPLHYKTYININRGKIVQSMMNYICNPNNKIDESIILVDDDRESQKPFYWFSFAKKVDPLWWIELF